MLFFRKTIIKPVSRLFVPIKTYFEGAMVFNSGDFPSKAYIAPIQITSAYMPVYQAKNPEHTCFETRNRIKRRNRVPSFAYFSLLVVRFSALGRFLDYPTRGCQELAWDLRTPLD